MVAIVTLALVASFQVDADLTADAGILAFVDVCAHRETDGEKRKTAGVFTRLMLQLRDGNHHCTLWHKNYLTWVHRNQMKTILDSDVG